MFYITISNGLLSNGHRKRMGAAVWEFMWCIDKVTRIDEDGTGWVLGGKPIKLSDLAEQMGVSEDTISRNLITLEEEGYIFKTNAPYGIIIKVKQAKKRFGRNVEPTSTKVSNLSRKNVEPNKTVSVDRTEDTSAKAESESSLSEEDTDFEPDEDFVPTKGFGKRNRPPSVEKELKAIFKMFADQNPAWIMWVRVPAQREAAKSLFERYGVEKTRGFYIAARRMKDEPFAPQVHSPYDLLMKLSKLKEHEERRD